MTKQRQLLWRPMTSELVREVVDPNNPECPLSQFIGNERVIRRLARAAAVALMTETHQIEQNFSLLGPASTGKTTLAKLFAKLVGLPFVEIHPRSVKHLDDIFDAISLVAAEAQLPLIPQQDNKFILPPMIVFIDEAHSLSSNVEQALLKATEPGDKSMVTPKGRKVDCSRVCWVIATTDRGLLFDAFDTRFTKLHLQLYTRDEIAQIIKMNYPQWPQEACDLVARYGGRVPREVLAFAREMANERMLNSSASWVEIAKQIADDHEIDEQGMTRQRRDILAVLGQQGATSKSRLALQTGVREEELDRYIMPALLARTADQEPMVSVTSRGYSITEAGLKALEVRGIVGNKVVES